MKLLCVTRDSQLSQMVIEEAARSRWTALTADREQSAEAVAAHDPDVVLVDAASDDDLTWWKDQSQDRLVLFLREQMCEDFLVNALAMGVDAVLPREAFSARMLSQGVAGKWRRHLKRTGTRRFPHLGLTIDGERQVAYLRGRRLVLTLTELRILRELATQDDHIVSREAIQAHAFAGVTVTRRSLDVHVCALRKKLKPFGLEIESIRGVGYRLKPCAA